MPISGFSQESPSNKGSEATLKEVVIKAADIGVKVKERKAPLEIQIDPYEAIRPQWPPELSQLIPDVPATLNWPLSYPDFLANGRVVERGISVFPDDQGVAFPIWENLEKALGGTLSSSEAKYCQWTLSIVDENGEIFQYYAGTEGMPPVKKLFWNGRNDRGDWIQVGHSYSPLYKFIGPEGSQHSFEGALVRFSSFSRNEPDGQHLAFDSAALFGPQKNLRAPDTAGMDLLRATADYLRIHDTLVVSSLKALGATTELAETQGLAVLNYLAQQLLMDPSQIKIKTSKAKLSDQSIEIILKNRPKMKAPKKEEARP